ncbi:Rossmann-like and DUF2520 domain-containing protein [Deinococcus yavapaiensis]|uniref:Putative short-subunit dehydrogenase-like oxidoreductase (DUF2520 family) n=1 Tax=Deinococcus yavapaiensis KR-236 TaxID=694435 RepID=A0A318STA7_9DEIO|nr:DUF2520 domain-containing protein [Deinococcus yavapaiensis]PYE56466.1 putative short-subunit dehydrogenase-like oxidoreductase (DUF2520 family) [Deinococcus yavapaiensis KR-236]
MTPRIGFLGAGRVGTTLALGWRRVGRDVRAAWSRSGRKISDVECLPAPQDVLDACDVVFVTVADAAVESTASAVTWSDRHLAVHCAGALDLDVLEAARRAGAKVASLHPLQTFADPDTTLTTLRGAAFTIEGDDESAALLSTLASDLGGRSLRLPAGHRALYHASAQYVGAFLTTLLRESAFLWRALGVSERDALAALVPLAVGTLRSAEAVGPVGALAGPLARGDAPTVERHLAALPEAHLDLYRALSLRALELARERGLQDDVAARLFALLESP